MCVFYVCSIVFFFFFKQKTAYEMRISDWSSDVLFRSAQQRRVVGSEPRQAVAHRQCPAAVLLAALRMVGKQARVAGIAAAGFDQFGQRQRVAQAEVEALRADRMQGLRSEERRLGKECVSPCGSRGSPLP